MDKARIFTRLWLSFVLVILGGFIGFFLGSTWLGAFLALVLLWLEWIWQYYKLHRWLSHIAKTGADDIDPGRLWSAVLYNRKRLERTFQKEIIGLKTQVKRAESIGRAFSDAVLLLDGQGRLAWWNTSAERYFNLRPNDQGQILTNLVRHPNFVRYFESNDYTQPCEISFWHNQQHLEFRIEFFGQNERLVSVRDITRMYKLEEMRKDFIANVSHELRTPLTVIQGYLETLLDYWPDMSQQPHRLTQGHSMLTQMESQTHRMSVLINDLITLSRLETTAKDVDPHPVVIGPLMHKIMAETQSISGEQGHKIACVGDNNWAIEGNERELQSAIMNLMVNAVNYSAPESLIKLIYGINDTCAFIQVEDKGVGIEDKHLARITERFYRVDPSRSVQSGGTGLGLAIVKHVLMRHHAELRMSSELGKGSVFRCEFPLRLVKKLDA